MARNGFDINGQAFKRDPFPTLRAMRAAGPLVEVRMPVFGAIMATTTHAASEALLKDHDRFSVDLKRGGLGLLTLLTRTPPLRSLADSMLQKDDPEHRRLRKLVDAAFRRAEMEALRPRIERLADEGLNRLAASADGDLVAHVARDLPLAVISELLGLPHEDRPKFIKWMSAMTEISSPLSIFSALPAIRRIAMYLRARFDERRTAPRGDLISALVQAEDGGDRLSERELLSMCFLLFAAGHETTTHLISGGVLALLRNPDQWARLCADPSLAASAVDELMRYVSPVQMSKPRFATGATELAGTPLAKGRMTMALLASANTDPTVFEAPETLDIGRARNRHLGFGGGVHFCLGAWLARTEMEALLQRLVARAPDLALAAPEADLRWRKRGGMRALAALPLRM